MTKIEKTLEIGGKKLTLSAGDIAGQANGAVLATYGETVVLATVVSAPLKSDLGYFPLSVEYQERLYAGGRIKGSRWVKREGRPTDEEILTGRLIDRSIRPLFPKEFNQDVQVINTVLSVDLKNSPDIVAAIATSAAISISDIPWKGPIGILRIGFKEKELIVNPTDEELKNSDMDIIISSTKDAIVMIEAGSNQIPEQSILDAISKAMTESGKLIDFINDFAKGFKVSKKILENHKPDEKVKSEVKKLADSEITKLVTGLSSKEASYADYDQIKAAVVAKFDEASKKESAAHAFEALFSERIREMLLSGKRPDGRKLNEIRQLSCKVSILPRTHGSAIFNRGQTQVLSIATIGAPSLEQSIETAEGEETKRYMHHYAMPPFSTGETGKIGSPNRREIGHGALAERALLPVIPKEEVFPYAIRVVSEVLSSNGSTSMASTCGSTMALLDAGVPIKVPVAGIAMGLVIESEKKFSVLTDIVGIEDGNGDMDFKVAGTQDGITALQLDVKTLKLTLPILEEAIKQAKDARLEILKVMNKALPEVRSKVSVYAPKIKLVKIDPSKIGELIGPGGKVIKSIIATTGAQVDVDDDGNVFISSVNEEDVKSAAEKVEALVKDPVPGEQYEGIVKRIQPFGAFVEILPGREGLVHVSDMSVDYVQNPMDIVKVGDKVPVKVKQIDELGRLNLTMILTGEKKQMNQGREYSRPAQNDNRHYERKYSKGPQRNYSKNDSRGPHFPTSRLLDQNKKNY